MLHERCFGVELSGSFARDQKQYGGTLLDTILKYINQSLSCGNFVEKPSTLSSRFEFRDDLSVC